MFYCGAFGWAFAAAGVAKMDTKRWANWKICSHLKMRASETADGQNVLYPCCEKGHVVDHVNGANLGRLLRGKPTKCPDYFESMGIVKMQVVTREELEVMGFDKSEIDTICGTRIIH